MAGSPPKSLDDRSLGGREASRGAARAQRLAVSAQPLAVFAQRLAVNARSLAACALLAATACSDPSPSGDTDSAPPDETATTTKKKIVPTVKAGDDVVAATSKVTFVQGKVIEVVGDKVKVEYGRKNPTTGERAAKLLAGNDVYALAAPSDVKKGEHLACRVGQRPTSGEPLPTWHPCRVEETAGDKLITRDHYDTRYTIGSDRVVRVREGTRKQLTKYIETEIQHRRFDAAFESAGLPPKPAVWNPEVGAPVVVHWVGTSWYGAKVVEVKAPRGKVRVDFEGDRWSDRDVAWREVAPQPAVGATGLREDQFVLVRPADPDDAWEHHRVVKVVGTDVELVNRSGHKKTAALTDVLPIIAPKKKTKD